MTLADERRPRRYARIVELGYSGAGSAGSGLGMHPPERTAELYGGSLAIRVADLGGVPFPETNRKPA